MSIGTPSQWWRRVRGRRRTFARTRVAAAVVVVVWAVAWVATSHVSAAPVPGQGNAYAETDRIDPRAGSLSVGVTFGETIAGHTNNIAKAQSQAIDLGSIGTSLTGYDCGKPPNFQPSQIPTPLIVETGDPGASSGITKSETGGAAGYPSSAPPFASKFGQADATPYSKAVTTTAPISIAGVISIGGGTSTATSGLINGQRVATASTDISGITFPGGVSLSGLHWDVSFPSTGNGQPTGSFSISHAAAGGQALPVNDPTQTFSQLNTILGTLGFVLDAPAVHLTQGIMFVDPLGISVVPSPTRDAVGGGAINGIQPVSQQLFAAVLQAFCNSDTFITVAQIAIGSITGAGSFNLTLGGTQASSGIIPANGFSLGLAGLSGGSLGSPGSAAAAGSSSPGTSGGSSSAVGGSAAGPAVSGPAGSAPGGGGNQEVALSPIKAFQGKRGGALATVGLGGLGLLGLLAEGDRRKMRHAQRTVTFEE